MYCFSTAGMVARMGISVKFCLHCLSCLLTSSATKQVQAPYPAQSFRWFLSPLLTLQVSVYQNLKMALSVTAAYSAVGCGEGGGLVFFVVGKFSPSTLFLKISSCVVLFVSFVDACPEPCFTVPPSLSRRFFLHIFVYSSKFDPM